MNALDPRHWTLNSWFGAFHTIWVHLGPFRRLTKLGSKRAELVQLIQKFMPRSRVRIFGDERTRSTPLDPKLMVWHILYCLGAFGAVSSPYKTLLTELVQLMQKFVPRSRVMIFHHDSK